VTTPASLGSNHVGRHGVREEPTVRVKNTLGCSDRWMKLGHSPRLPSSRGRVTIVS